MRRCRPLARVAQSAALMLLATARAASGQVIAIRTVPLAQGDQFQIFPSANVGMGGVSIALADSVRDPFVNPATAGRVNGTRFFSAPTVYGISDGAGGGRTLPFATLTRAGAWFAGFALAAQQVDASRAPNTGVIAVPVNGVVAVGPPAAPPAPRQDSYGNQYALALLGRKLSGTGLALGASVSWARLTGVDGVDLLFPGNAGLTQFGHALDLRLGLLKEWPSDASLEVLALYDRLGMTDDAQYLDPFWDPATQSFALRPRTDQNRDQTNTWGLQLGYMRPLGQEGWHVGWLLTANAASYPKLPAYQLPSVPALPWDPGRSSAYNLGIGFAKTRGPTTVGVDLIYEPIWSYTWADATSSVVTALGDTIPTGGKTLENHFRFSNSLVRLGLRREIALESLGRVAELQLGLVVHTVHYRLAQFDAVQARAQSLTEGWVEWTPTWGLGLRFPDVEIRYRGYVTTGTGRPGVQGGVFAAGRDMALAGGGILVAPSGPVTLQDVSTTTHQISVSVPLR